MSATHQRIGQNSYETQRISVKKIQISQLRQKKCQFPLFPITCIKPCSCAQFAPGCKFAPLASRSYAKKSCSYAPTFDLKFNTSYIVLWSNSLYLNVLGDSDPLLLRFMYVIDTSMAGCAAETFTFHKYKSWKSIILI